jgi:hypothetical protein
MADRSGEDHVSVHHEDFASSGGPSSSHNLVARHLFPEANVDSATPVTVPVTTTSTLMATVAGDVSTYVANIEITNTTPHVGSQPLQNL